MFDYDEIEAEDPSPAVRLNFRIDDKMMTVRNPTMRLPSREHMQGPPERYEDSMRMFVTREGMTTSEIAAIWEKEWNVPYAGRIKFVLLPAEDAAPGETSRQLRRLDPMPSHPAVVRLEGISSVITALIGQLKLRDPLYGKTEEVEEMAAVEVPLPNEAKMQQQPKIMMTQERDWAEDAARRWTEASTHAGSREVRRHRKSDEPDSSEAGQRLASMLCLDEDD
mmetsp:Transcript_23229/g.53203  ORF Transcript_23229/g.53203 Transcript_23229/m.53203 type:complete len:223 (+) Transcript_23229:164-832(+)